ncbi:MAG: type II secretion system F family protein [Eubacteriales bacterium]|nr:type II secretion system F family protein [Eubacteriales bacterium]
MFTRMMGEKANRKRTFRIRSESTDYSTYRMSPAERLKYIFTAVAVIFPVTYLFYRRAGICLALCCVSLLYPSVRRKGIIAKRKKQLLHQFRDMLYSISSSLSAGRSAENSFKAAAGDLALIYSGEEAYMIKELKTINIRIRMNEPLAEVLEDFAVRAGLEDIKDFAGVFSLCRQTGGNLAEAVRNTASVITQKIDIRGEIDVIIAEQRLNQRILSIMPFGLMVMIVLGSPDYAAPLYTPVGNAVMTIVLILITAANFIGKKITEINV